MEDKMIVEAPTPGRIVHYGQVEGGKIVGDMLPAGVVEVVGTSEENIVVLDRWGSSSDKTRSFACVHASETEDGKIGWDWMPYQKGQLKKLEQVQAIDQPGLRRPMSSDELGNRFTYHAPTPEQAGKYWDIRTEARNFAVMLQTHCPPSPELASALDHLDTVVFKANAAIARHSTPTQETSP